MSASVSWRMRQQGRRMGKRRLKRGAKGRFVPVVSVGINGVTERLVDVSRDSGINIDTLWCRMLAGHQNDALIRPLRQRIKQQVVRMREGDQIVLSGKRRSIVKRLRECREWYGVPLMIVESDGDAHTIECLEPIEK